ncbi:MAG TPA: NAD(P)H-binding protein, partial [Ktedonobacteraceae bacterium]|nr:NAD(P)H-binding protein [Ktedonobacteraceae bacterium]
QSSSIDWTIVRPYRLTDGEGTTHYKVASAPFPSPLIIRTTTRADVADFMVKELQARNFSKKIAFISTRSVANHRSE